MAEIIGKVAFKLEKVGMHMNYKKEILTFYS